MKQFSWLIIILIMIPSFGFAQLKTNLNKPNISQTLDTYNKNDAFVGFLDPSRIQMSHNLSMSYVGFGGGGAMINTYVNTLNYKFSDELYLTTNLGIMNSPYNSLPGNNYMNEYEFFGGAELKYMPSENSVISLRFEKSPGYYSPYNYYNRRSPFGAFQSDW